MSMRTYNRVQSFPIPESDTSSPLSNQFDQFLAPNLENLDQHLGSRISADGLFKILNSSMVAQKMGMKLAMDAINPTTGSNSDEKFIKCYLNSTVLLLDACNNIQLRLESIRNCLDSIPIGLHYLESEHELSKAILQQAVTALESSRFRDKHHCSKMEKNMSRMKTFGKKLSGHRLANQDTGDSISPELYRALSGSWTMAVLAIGVLNSATSIRSLSNPCVQSLKAEPRTILLNRPSNKMKAFHKKSIETASMEELACADLASQTLLKLILAWQKGGGSNLRRMAVKAVAGEFRRRKEVLEKTLPLLEKKIEEFYQQIVAIRISMFGLLSKVQKEKELELEMVKHSSYEETQTDANPAQCQRGVVNTKVTAQSFSLGQIGPRCNRLI